MKLYVVWSGRLRLYFILFLFLSSSLVFAEARGEARVPAELSFGPHSIHDLVLAGDGSGFTPINGHRVYDEGKWYILDVREDWDNPRSVLWEWDAARDPDLTAEQRKWFIGSRDGKFVRGHSEVLLVASSGGIALVQVHPKKLLYVANVGLNSNAHSADLLPDGSIAVVTAYSQQLILLSTREEESPNSVQATYAFPGAHGVSWDSRHQALWVLGSELVKYEYNFDRSSPAVRDADHFPLPLDSMGHDLFPSKREDKLFVTTNGWTGTFDPESGHFDVIEKFDQTGVKSISEDLVWGLIAYTYAEPDSRLRNPNLSWWTPTVHFFSPDGKTYSKTKLGARFYKVRW